MQLASPEMIRPEAHGGARLVSAGLDAALERFRDRELLDAGRVNVISVEAVHERFGPRWEHRREQVHGFAERVIERGVGAHGFYLRVSDTDFFVVHPELDRVAGQTACLRYLREVLNHFLGEDQMAAAGVLRVTEITSGRVRACRTDVEVEDEPDAQAVPPEPEPDGSIDRWTPFVASDGRRLRVSATLEPVYELKGFSRIGFRMVRRVMVMRHGRGCEEELGPEQVARLSTSDILRIDLATIARGVDRLRADAPVERQLSLIVPLSYTSLASQKGRSDFVAELKHAGRFVKLGVICEISDIEGVPTSALLAATSLIRPFALLVIGRISSGAPGALARVRDAGLQALSFECPPNHSDAEFVGWAQAMVGAARRLTKVVLVYHAGSLRRAAALGPMGASHVSL